MQDWATQQFAYPVDFEAEHPPDTWTLNSPLGPGDVESCAFGSEQTKTSFKFFRSCSLDPGGDTQCAGGYAHKAWKFSATKNKLKVTSTSEVTVCVPRK